jgi:hypothetical protein
VRHGSVVRTASNSWSPETYSAEALAAESLPWPLSWASIICHPDICCQTVGKCRTKLSGGECLEPALCWVNRLLVHHNTFLEIGPLQPLDYLSIILLHMVSLVLFRVSVPVMKSIPFIRSLHRVSFVVPELSTLARQSVLHNLWTLSKVVSVLLLLPITFKGKGRTGEWVVFWSALWGSNDLPWKSEGHLLSVLRFHLQFRADITLHFRFCR